MKDANELFEDPQERPRHEADRLLDAPQKTNDPQQLKDKALSDRQKEYKNEGDLLFLLKSEQGVRVISRILYELCRHGASVYSPNFGEMANIAGRRQVGQGIEEWVKNADLELWFKVERELDKHRPKAKKPG